MRHEPRRNTPKTQPAGVGGPPPPPKKTARDLGDGSPEQVPVRIPMQVFIKRNGESSGPYALEQVLGWLDLGRLTASDFLRDERGGPWIPIHLLLRGSKSSGDFPPDLGGAPVGSL